MLKTAPRSLLPAALLSALVGLAGCHISIGHGSSSQSPNTGRSKPAKHTPSKSSTSSTTSKPIQKKSTEPTSEPEPTTDAPDDKTSEGPHRDQPDTTDPKRTLPTSDPKRTPPTSDPKRTPKPLPIGEDEEGGAGAGTIDRPGTVVAPTKDDGAKDISRPGTLTAPK
jgi:hypothetical protein